MNKALFVRRSVAVMAVVGTMAVAVNGAFAAVAWDNPSGSNARLGWSGGENNTDLFGDPSINEAGFFFNNPDNFRADLTVTSATDFARVQVNTNNSTPAGAAPIETITVREWGTWTHEISEVSDFTVQADYSIFRYSPFPPGSTGALDMPVTFNPDGTWHAELTLNVGDEVTSPIFDWDQPAVDFQITVTNTIQVAVDAPVGSFIEKEGMWITVPEPSTGLICLMGLGSLALRSSRRRG